MIFGRVPVADAFGAVLAHTHRLPGRVLKKGTVLDDDAVAALLAAKVESVIAARLEPGDLNEDAAARRIAAVLLGPGRAGLTATRAATGRVNLVAASAGLLHVNAAAVNALNAVDEAVTIATLHDATPVAEGDMVATIKIIPFAVPGAVLDRAAATAKGGVMSVLPWQARRVGLVLTTLPGLKQSVITGTITATATRIASVGGTMLPPLQCPHQEAPIAEALKALLADGADLLLVAGASAVVDRRDVGPAGIVAAGGTILHFGMPVDPGNLICLGRIGNVPALVLPGCARSPALNGIDWVLHRLAAGIPVDGAAVARMGVGGLLKDVGARPLPRARATKRPATAVSALVLAAGQSSRMAPRHKLLERDSAGVPMVAKVVDNLIASRARPIRVVVGHRAEEVMAALQGRAVSFIQAPDYADGLSASLRAGLAAVMERAVLVVLADMPLVTGTSMNRLIDTYDPDEGRLIVVPTHDGQWGNPVLWDRRYIPAMMDLTGDSGARKLLRLHADAVAEVALDESVLRDFDTPESLAALADSTVLAR
jgi:molybdenum cofactor cytidylyltransferase